MNRNTRKVPTEVKELKLALDTWRETSLVFVCSNEIVPDTSNRVHTGLSVDHVHFIASSILKYGFRDRKTAGATDKRPHDIPVLVRGDSTCPIPLESLEVWKDQVAQDEDFPDCSISVDARRWFCSLGKYISNRIALVNDFENWRK